MVKFKWLQIPASTLKSYTFKILHGLFMSPLEWVYGAFAYKNVVRLHGQQMVTCRKFLNETIVQYSLHYPVIGDFLNYVPVEMIVLLEYTVNGICSIRLQLPKASVHPSGPQITFCTHANM